MTSLIYVALGYFIDIIGFLVLIRCILSWLPLDRTNPFVGFIYRLTEPLLSPIRDMLYRSPLGGPGMVLDISPIILFMLLEGLKTLVFNFLR